MEYCSSCKRFDISLSGFLSHPGFDDNPRLKAPIYTIGTLHEINKRLNTCHLCCLISAAFVSGPVRTYPGLRDPHEVSVSGTWINGLGPSKEQRLKGTALCILVWADLTNKSSSTPHPLMPCKIIVRAVSRMFPDQPHFARLSPVTSSFLDFDIIKKWLRHCESKHESCSHASQTLQLPTKNFLVIDVVSDCIVKAPDGCKYLALSYVWGSVNQIRLREENLYAFTVKGSLSKTPLTRTIRNAITLTQALGHRYLWVDALCILQDVEVVRQQTIDDMDRIFAQSLLTIVAGTCESANDPLPGIGKKRSWKQEHHKVSNGLTLSAHFDFRDYLESTKYNERAWTFQEYQLANRILVFAPNGQVYFSCRDAVYSEEVIAGPEMQPDAALLEGADLIKLRPDPNHLWSVYQQGVLNFSARRMTYEKDILNAFAGILRMVCSERSLEGLPLPIFDLALLWQPRHQLRRRNGFSSWSWAGWVGRVHWLDDHGLLSESKEKTEAEQIASWMMLRAWIVWYSSWGTNVRSPAYIMDGPPWLRGSAPSAETHEHRFPGTQHRFMPRPTSLPRCLESVEPQRRHIRYLQFWTMSAYFEIEYDKDKMLKIPGFESGRDSKGLRPFVLHDRDGRACGWVLLDETWVDRAAQSDIRRQEFIMLSEGRCLNTNSSAQKDHSYPTEASDEFGEFNAMMITTTGGLSERAGLGRVMKSALPYSCWRDAKWKEIILG